MRIPDCLLHCSGGQTRLIAQVAVVLVGNGAGEVAQQWLQVQ